MSEVTPAHALPRVHACEVLCFGEAIVDLIARVRGVRLRDAVGFDMYQGGAPANVAVGLARRGRRVALHSAVGDDEFGAFLLARLAASGVSVDSVRVLEDTPTAITFLSIDEHGDRHFHPVRRDTADRIFSASMLDLGLISGARIFHYGSSMMTRARNREATVRALDRAVASGALISFDPNLRPGLWADPAVGVQLVREMLPRVHLLKVSEEESKVLSGCSDPEGAWEVFYGPLGVTALVVTRGLEGAMVFTRRVRVDVPAPTVEVVDTTGAGDAFVAALLAGLSDLRGAEVGPTELLDLDEDEWDELLTAGTLAGSEACTMLGATGGAEGNKAQG